MPLAQLITAEQLARRLTIPRCAFSIAASPWKTHLRRAQLPPRPCRRQVRRPGKGPIRPGHPWCHRPAPTAGSGRLAARFRQWGLDDDSDVVLYDDGPGALPHGHGAAALVNA